MAPTFEGTVFFPKLPGENVLKQPIVNCTLITLRSRTTSTIVSIRSASEWPANLLFFWQQRRLKLLGCIVAANGPAATSRLPLAA